MNKEDRELAKKLKIIVKNYGAEVKKHELTNQLTELIKAVSLERAVNIGLISVDKEKLKNLMIESLANAVIGIDQILTIYECGDEVFKLAEDKLNSEIKKICTGVKKNERD